VGYSPRRFARSPLYRLLLDHWDAFLSEYEEQFQHRYGSLRSVIERIVPRYLDCGNPMNGFARIRCSECGHERLLPFTCKCRGYAECRNMLSTVASLGAIPLIRKGL